MVIRRAAIVLLFLAAAALQGAPGQDVPRSGNPSKGRLPASASITASFNALLLDSHNHMVFLYVFRNNSPQDYEIPGDASTRLFAVLTGRKNKSRELSAQEMYVRYPIVVYPHQVQIVTLHDMVHTYVITDHLKFDPTKPESDRYEYLAKPPRVQIVALPNMARPYLVNDQKVNPIDPGYDKYEIAAKAAVRKVWPELNGFRLDDTRTGQSISLPRPF